MDQPVSMTELLEYIERTKEHFATSGKQLNDGAERVHGKLRDRSPGIVFRRTYITVPEGYAMWDVIADTELAERGYRDTGAHSYGLVGSSNVETDTITYWTSEKEHGNVLWIGLPMAE